MAETSKNPAWKELQLPLFLIIAVSLAVYVNALVNGFVYDDRTQILGNLWIRDARFLPNIFLSDEWGFRSGNTSNYYRPIMHVVYMLDYHLFGLRPWGYHLVNVLFHIGSSALVFLIARVLLKGYKSASKFLSPPLVAALLFAVHPIHTEAVAWVAGITDLSYSFFCLLSLYLYIRSEDRFDTFYYLSVAAFFLGTLCKEPALTLPGILIAYDLLLRKERPGFLSIAKRYALFALAIAAYFGLRLYALGGRMAPTAGHGESVDFRNVFLLFATYFKKLVVPVNLKIFYDFRPAGSLTDASVLLAAIITALVVAAFYISYKKDRLAFFCLLAVTIPLVPCLYTPAITGPSMLGERYLYLPSAGFVMLVSIMVSRLAGTKARKIALSMVLMLAAMYSAGTIMRNADWKNEYTLWLDSAKKSPGSADAHNNLGAALIDIGMYDKAQEETSQAIALNPYFAEAHNNLGISLFHMGANDKALVEFLQAVTIKQDYGEAYDNLGVAYAKVGQYNLAVGAFLDALKCNPFPEDTHKNLGIAYTNLGMLDKAIGAYEESLRVRPDDAEVHNNIGIGYADKGDMKSAVEHFQAAARLDPGNHRFRENLEKALAAAQ
jgi:tetratricopeptide (TPR) repeat protein